MRRIRCCGPALVLLASIFAACGQAGWNKVSPNAKARQRVYVQEQLNRLFDGKYAELEKEAAAPSFPEPESIDLTREEVFFESFSYDAWTDEPDWARFFKAMDGWRAAYPDSPCNHLARATALVNYAWEARGGGTANTVGDSGWQLFGDRLQESAKQLEEALRRGGDRHPTYWRIKLILCRGLELTAEETLEVAEKAIKQFPEDPNVYYLYCISILPRWGGETGQWQAWIKSQNKDARWGEGKEMEARLYARILWRVFKYVRNTDGPFFEDKNLSWEKALAGTDALCEKYPPSDYWKTARAYFAWSAQDPKALKEAVIAMHNNYDSWAIAPNQFLLLLQDKALQ